MIAPERKGTLAAPPFDAYAMNAECGICWDTMLPCQEVSQSECHPMSHFFHLDCYNRWLQTQRVTEPTRCCPACRQFEIGEADWYDFAEIFGIQGDGITAVAELPQQAQRYIRSWQRGTVTEAEKRATADGARLLRIDHAHYPTGRP
jgi:hypothetical protein